MTKARTDHRRSSDDAIRLRLRVYPSMGPVYERLMAIPERERAREAVHYLRVGMGDGLVRPVAPPPASAAAAQVAIPARPAAAHAIDVLVGVPGMIE